MVAGADTVFEPESRAFSASEEGLKYTMADAMVFNSMAHRLMANFYLKFNKPSRPSKAFTSIESAREWLLSIKK